jgi:hypothetical protein
MRFRRHAFHTLTAAILAGLLAAPSGARAAEPITLTARLAQPVMKSGGGQTNFLRIGLNGCEPQRTADRTPVNVAFVIDRSGSMTGERIAQARAAAVMAVKRLDDKDIASVVIFDDKVDVPVPAQKVADHNYFIDRILQVAARGNTAIYAGVNAGADEVPSTRTCSGSTAWCCCRTDWPMWGRAGPAISPSSASGCWRREFPSPPSGSAPSTART